MGRTKGSKNKQKSKFNPMPVKEFIKKVKADMEEIATPEEAEELAHHSVENSEIVPRGKLCKCGHEKELHYEGLKGHCNRNGCSCLEYEN